MMSVLKEFDIPFVGLKIGKHDFLYTIEPTFFSHFGFTDFQNLKINAKVTLDKKPSFLELHFAIEGNGQLQCDVSMEWYNQKISTTYDLVVKFGSAQEKDSDEIVILSEGTYQINIAHYLYESIVLSLPIKRIHPGVEDGSLQNEILEKLKALEPKEEKLNGQHDPRWNKLKDLL
jgi:uncharacterized metal-binding protein YceD (DUF177 family)